MKNLFLALILMLGLVSCGNTPSKKNETVSTGTTSTERVVDQHNARNSLSYAGIYEGTIPCADCPGIDMVITLDYNGNYTKKMTYQGKEPDNTFISSGEFVWDDKGTFITLQEKDGEKFMVIENGLLMLDTEGNVITGENADLYRLRQTTIAE